MNEHLIDYEKAKGSVVLKILKSYLKLNLNGKRILEIGCSTGAHMELLEQQGADVYEIDVESAWSKNYYWKPDRQVICDLQDENIPSEIPTSFFELIIAQGVIKHIKKPYEFLTNIHQLLSPTGKLFLTTPDLSGITAIMKGQRWCGTATGGHVLLYNQRSLNFLLHNYGFQKLESFTNIVPIVYQDKYPSLWYFNRIFMWTGVGGG